MFKNLIDMTVGAESLTTVDTAQTTLETTFNFATSVPVDERMKLFKIGANTEEFAARILELAKRNIDLLPRGLDLDAIERDKVAREQLIPRLDRLRQFVERLEHTVLLLGVDYLAGTRVAYRSLKANGKTAGLEDLLADIGQCFAHPRKPAATTPEQPASGSGTGTGTTTPTA